VNTVPRTPVPSRRPSDFVSFRIETVPRRIGIMIPSAKKSARNVLPRKSYSASAYAVIAESSTTRKTDASVTIRLFVKYVVKCDCVQTVL